MLNNLTIRLQTPMTNRTSAARVPNVQRPSRLASTTNDVSFLDNASHLSSQAHIIPPNHPPPHTATRSPCSELDRSRCCTQLHHPLNTHIFVHTCSSCPRRALPAFGLADRSSRIKPRIFLFFIRCTIGDDGRNWVFCTLSDEFSYMFSSGSLLLRIQRPVANNGKANPWRTGGRKMALKDGTYQKLLRVSSMQIQFPSL